MTQLFKLSYYYFFYSGTNLNFRRKINIVFLFYYCILLADDIYTIT